MHIINKSRGKLILPEAGITMLVHGDITKISKEIAESREVQTLVELGWVDLHEKKSELSVSPDSFPEKIVPENPSQGLLELPTKVGKEEAEEIAETSPVSETTSEPVKVTKPRAKKEASV